MSANTKIEWTDHSSSPWHGCSHGVYVDAHGNEHEHPGCAHCYAEAGAKRNPGTLGVWGTEGTRVRSASFANNCRRWNKEAEKAGVRQSVFPSICDPFEDWKRHVLDSHGCVMWNTPEGVRGAGATTPNLVRGERPATMDDLRRDLFAVIDSCPWLDFYLLTKRPGNVRKMWPRVGFPESGVPGTLGRYLYLDNVYLITSISNQETADAMIPLLLESRGLVPVLGLSCEPLLGPIDLCTRGSSRPDRNRSAILNEDFGGKTRQIDWCIVGGESGHGARPCDIGWIRSIVKQCMAAAVPCFVKQFGGNVEWNGMQGGYMDGVPDVWPRSEGSEDTGRGNWRKHLMDKKGGDPSEWPEDFRIREYPTTKVSVSSCPSKT